MLIALDLSNIFYIIDTKNAEVVLINDAASKVIGTSGSIGTYCEIIVCLNSFQR